MDKPSSKHIDPIKKNKTAFILPSKKSKAINIVQPEQASTTDGSQASSTAPRPNPTQRSESSQSTNGILTQLELSDSATRVKGDNNTSTATSRTRRTETTSAVSQIWSSPSEKTDVKSESSERDSKSASSLDIYAAKYVPYWLRAINHSNCTAVFPAPAFKRLDFAAYIKQFAGSNFLVPIHHVELPTKICGIKYKAIDFKNYSAFWHERLQLEMGLTSRANNAYSLYNVKLEVHDAAINQYALKVAGIREFTPLIDLGDVIRLREIRPDIGGDIAARATSWEGRGLAPGFTGCEYEAVVIAVLRRYETIIISLAPTFSFACSYNVLFPLHKYKFSPAWRAVGRIGSIVSTLSNVTNHWAMSMLFPEESNGIQQTHLSPGTFDLQWKDKSLNFEQKRAVQAVVDAKYGCIPYLISGPPGTGKTKTLVETALQLLDRPSNPRAHILMCAPSDSAADILVIRLAKYLSPRELFRLNSWTRQSAEIPDRIIPYTFLNDDQLFAIPDFKTMMEFRIVVTTCRDADILEQARLTNEALSIVTSLMLKMVAPSVSVDPINLSHWTCLLLDEAAQATEPETLIPVGVVMPLQTNEASVSLPQVVMAGDEYQLGPRVFKNDIHEAVSLPDPPLANGLEKSMFERLFSREIYAKHPLSRSNGLRMLTAALLPIIRPPFTNLIRNYRSHPAILSVPSALFYVDTLIPEQLSTSESILSWHRWPSPYKWPVLFHQNDSADAVASVLEGDGTGAGSLSNHGEAAIALEMVQDLLSHSNDSHMTTLRPVDIIVMSPFRAQVNHLRNVFRTANLHDVNIGPLEAFQGLESRVVILCTTRTRVGNGPGNLTKFVEEDKLRGLGIIDEPKRFNVAITRAKEALMVIGDAQTLTCTKDPCWLAFLEFCGRSRLLTKETDWVPRRTEAAVGRLERALIYAENVQRHGKEYAARTLFYDGRDDAHSEGSGLFTPSVAAGQPSFKFRLKGTLIDLDEEMWRNADIDGAEGYDVDVDVDDGEYVNPLN